MSNSSLVSYTKLSPNCSIRTTTIKKITIHHAASVNASLAGLGAWFAQPAAGASSNYGIDSEGKVGMFVEEKNRAWTSSSTENDDQAVTIEVANSAGAPNWPVSDKAYATLIDLCVDICKRNNIKKINFTGDKNGNLTMHKYFAPTGCPGPYLESRFSEIADKINERLGNSTPAPTPAPTPTPVPTPSPSPVPTNRPVLSMGAQGSAVVSLQKDLIALKYDLGTYGADGAFGALTYKAVISLQNKHGLVPDGIVGPLTYAAIDEDLAKKKPQTQTSQQPQQQQQPQPQPQQKVPFLVRVNADLLNIRKGPGTNYPITAQIRQNGIYTIVEVKDNWGKLKSGAGWI